MFATLIFVFRKGETDFRWLPLSFYKSRLYSSRRNRYMSKGV